MSYDIIKNIKIKDNKVFFKCASNNVFPKYFEKCESYSLSKILQEQGKEALDIEILKEYEKGNFQKGSNKYVRALQVLRHMQEYKNFDWRQSSYNDDCPIQKNRKDESLFNALLKKALYTMLPKDKYIVTKQHYDGSIIYLWKVTKKSAKWCYNKEKAKIFRYENDAKKLTKCFHGGENWKIEKIK